MLMLCMAVGFAACSDDDEKTDDPTLPDEPDVPVEVPLSVELNATYEIPMGQVLQIAPKVTGSGEYTYEWKEGETVISTRDTLEYVRPEAKTYHLTLTVKSETEADTVECDVAVSSAELSSGSILIEYKPTMVAMNLNYADEDNNYLRLPYDEALAQYNTVVKETFYLGSTGGYCIFKFDHTVANLPDSLDFEASMYEPNAQYANALYMVYVAYDRNKNGVPDEDEWYEIKGSQYGTDNEIADYEITYDGFPSKDKMFYSETYGWNLFPITWKDNQGNSGEDYLLSALTTDEYVCPLPGTYMDGSGFYEGWESLPWVRKGKVLKSIPEDKTGYIFVGFKDKRVRTFMDIDWAVDKDGNPAMLPGIDFVKIQNASPKIEEKNISENYMTGVFLFPRASDNTL